MGAGGSGFLLPARGKPPEDGWRSIAGCAPAQHGARLVPSMARHLHQKPRTKDNRSLKAPGPRQSWPSKPWPELEIPRLLGGDEDLPAHVAALLGARLLVLPGCRVRVRLHVESRMVHERLSVDLVWKFKASTVIVGFHSDQEASFLAPTECRWVEAMELTVSL